VPVRGRARLWQAPDAARQHYEFILESLRDLYRALRQLGGRLHLVTGDVVEVLDRLHAAAPFGALFPTRRPATASLSARSRGGPLVPIHGVRWQEFPSSAWCGASPAAMPGRPAGKP
jgi:deoxyribodipyrimidine photo-lyase